ncbi:MAG: DNA polymerase V family protein [Pseudomonadota bacterium]|nr:DNA polymerase V family protein [Pseudomonadota bacterium]
MAKTPTRAATAPFAHLLSLVTGKSPKAEDDKPAEDADDEETETDAEDDKPAEGAEGDKPEEDASAEDDKPEGKRARRAKAAEKDEDEEAESKAESDEDDEEMAQARSEGYAAAQARGRRIFGAASAGLRPDMAAHLAFNDAMPSAQAIGMLDMAAGGAVPPATGSRLHRRMARVVTPNPGTGENGGKKPEEMSFGEMAKAVAIKAGLI